MYNNLQVSSSGAQNQFGPIHFDWSTFCFVFFFVLQGWKKTDNMPVRLSSQSGSVSLLYNIIFELGNAKVSLLAAINVITSDCSITPFDFKDGHSLIFSFSEVRVIIGTIGVNQTCCFHMIMSKFHN